MRGDYTFADNDGYCLVTGEQVFESTYNPIYEDGKLVRMEITTKRMFVKCHGDCQACEWYKEYKEAYKDVE